ncbi:MAG: caspase family protein, partial [Propylenella sp.]
MLRASSRFAFVAFLATLLVAPVSAQAARRVALVIGNDAYQNLPALEKAAADAEGYANLARQKGFDEVIGRTNLTRQEMDIAIAEFLQAIQPGDTAVFVYSGHGWSDGAQNYLVGVDAPKQAAQALLARISIPLQNGINGILDEVAQRGASLKVAIIDACRDNPFAPEASGRSIGLGRGLARVDPPGGTFVVFSAGAGQVALDRLSDADPNPNGVFTRVFLPLLGADMPLLDAVKTAQQEVYALARDVRHNQEPAYYDQVRGKACLSASCDAPAAPQPTPAPLPSMDREALFWSTIASSGNASDFEAYLEQFPSGVFAPLARNRLAALTPATATPPPPPAATAVTACDRMAAHPNNRDNAAGVTPVNFDSLKAVSSAAIAACREAVAGQPGVARFTFQLGRALHAGGQYAEALTQYEKAAAADYPVAMNNLGIVYQDGLGVTRDYGEARRWFEKAAEHDYPEAMTNVGLLHEYGNGVAQSYPEARRWYEKAAALDDSASMNNLGLLYQYARGVQQDLAEARRWYEKAAEQSHSGAMNNLGVLYERGDGVAQSYAEARRWYEKSAELGDGGAMNNLGLIYQYARGVQQDYAEARRWYEKGADKGSTGAMNNIGILYEYGYGVPQSYSEARRWYEKAAEAGNAVAMNNLGQFHANGRGVTQDFNEARRWYEKAASQGNTGAMRNVGLLYQNGQGVAQDYAQARSWFEKAANLGYNEAMTDIGLLYANGNGVGQSYTEAKRWYEKAAALGEADSTRNIGLLYQNGQGVAQD